MSILASMSSSPIHRLKRTWDQVPSKVIALHEKLRRLMAPTRNYAKYRKAIQTSNPPCVPFLGCYLTDLTFLEDALPTRVSSQQNLINFSKMGKIAAVIQQVQQFQQTTYAFANVPEISEFICDGWDATIDEEQMYQLSLQLEPRNDK
jgi:son of sevenless